MNPVSQEPLVPSTPSIPLQELIDTALGKLTPMRIGPDGLTITRSYAIRMLKAMQATRVSPPARSRTQLRRERRRRAQRRAARIAVAAARSPGSEPSSASPAAEPGRSSSRGRLTPAPREHALAVSP
jgi:hypothetical protein